MNQCERSPEFSLRPVLMACLVLMSMDVSAFDIDTGNPDAKLRWDNTIKYTLVDRLKSPDAELISDPNLDDGNRNFGRGIASNRIDLMSELDGGYKNYGFRLSGAAWYDGAYNRNNDNNSGTINTYSVGAGKFTNATRDVMGRKGELLDAFVYYKSDASAETPLTLRLGKHSVLYGETLFFGANGIAGAQAPVDIVKALTVPGSQFKEIIRPVGQISGQVQLSTEVAVGAYVQYDWEKTRIPAAGSYLSDADIVGVGSELFFGPGFLINETKARDSGQGGIQIKFSPAGSDIDYGVYAARYHDKAPQLYIRPVSGTVQQVYAEGINTYGVSFSTVVSGANVAGEASIRTNAPLVSDPQLDLAGVGNGSDNPLYAVGKTAHLNLSMINLFDKTPLWDSASLLAEIGWNRTLSISKNPGALDPNTTRDATAFSLLFEPQRFQVLDGVDVSVPIGLSYTLAGRSSAVSKFNGGVEHGGIFSIGISADYQKSWKASVNYVNFFGSKGSFLTPTNPPTLSYKQSLADRDFISLSIQHSF